MNELFVYLEYHLSLDSFVIQSNIKEEKIKDIVSDYLQCQIGTGVDVSERNEHDVYKIYLQLDLSDDSYIVRHNCGNKGLREGILMHYLNSDNVIKEYKYNEMFSKEDFTID